MKKQNLLPKPHMEQAKKNYIKAAEQGASSRSPSKMGISTVQSYRGAQIFEAIGLGKDWSTNTSPAPPAASRRPLEVSPRIAQRHIALPADRVERQEVLDNGGSTIGGATGSNTCGTPNTVAKLQQAVAHHRRPDVVRNTRSSSTTRRGTAARSAG
jgi:glutamate synthase domain-containing protein 2